MAINQKDTSSVKNDPIMNLLLGKIHRVDS